MKSGHLKIDDAVTVYATDGTHSGTFVALTTVQEKYADGRIRTDNGLIFGQNCRRKHHTKKSWDFLYKHGDPWPSPLAQRLS